MEKEIKYETPMMIDGREKTTYDLWKEAGEIFPGKHIAVKQYLYDLETGMLTATLSVRDK